MLTAPTDNLYKFLCVLGLIVVSASIGLLIKATDAMDRDTAEFVTLLSDLQTAYTKYRFTIDRALVIVREAGGFQSKGTFEQKEQVSKLLAESDPQQEKATAALARAQFPAKLYEERLARYHTIKALCFVGIGLGGLLFFGGLALWYRRVQRILDANGLARS